MPKEADRKPFDFEGKLYKQVGEAILRKAKPLDLQEVMHQKANPSRNLAIYIHVPFCSEICKFCAFHRQLGGEEKREQYTTSLEQHIRQSLQYVQDGQKVSSIYIGGGTPSLLTLDQAERILAACRNTVDTSNARFTFEMHPENVTESYIEGLQGIGITRFSIGIQNLSAEERRTLGRTITSPQTDLEKLQILNTLGVQYNLDLMFGTPTQTLKSWMETVQELLELGKPPEVTLYQYVDAYGSATRKQLEDGELKKPGVRERHTMYNRARSHFSHLGYRPTGTLSFAKDDNTPKRNLLNNNTDMLGLGPRTYSKINNVFFINNARTHDFRPGKSTAEYYGIEIPATIDRIIKDTFSKISKQKGRDTNASNALLASWHAEAITQTYGVLYYILNQAKVSKYQP